MAKAMAKVFFSYSHKDEQLRDELEKHLASLKHRGLIESWHDRRIGAGEEWELSINSHLHDADVILLLVSSDFIASRYCYEIEMQEALRKHDAKEATVVPIILRPCVWHDLPFGKLQAATRDGQPVNKFPSLDDGFLEVVQSIKAALIKKTQPDGVAEKRMDVSPYVDNEVPLEPSKIRSSNLGLRRAFSDRERDMFVIASFEYIAAYFENSLKELCARNPTHDYRFKLRDAHALEALIYSDGKQVAKCGIWLDEGSFRQGIAFSYSGIGLGNGFNENLSVVDDGQCLGLRALGMAIHVGMGREDMLTQEGAAEGYWALFIKPLQ